MRSRVAVGTLQTTPWPKRLLVRSKAPDESALFFLGCIVWVAFRHAGKSLQTERDRTGSSDQRQSGTADVEINTPLGALAFLATRQRAIVIYFYYEDFSIADIAQATGVSRMQCGFNYIAHARSCTPLRQRRDYARTGNQRRQ